MVSYIHTLFIAHLIISSELLFHWC